MKREDINYLSQLVDEKKLKSLYKKIKKEHNILVLTDPCEQTLLVPIKDPISNGSFYSGEVLVTSTIVEVNKEKGWSMVMDSNEKISVYTAVLDASFAQDIYKKEIEALLEEALRTKIKNEKYKNQQVNSTRVNFDLL
jgi:alpha-D-ribose 1-methylphosphonate 5-triphosphate synthase subunit PhnG